MTPEQRASSYLKVFPRYCPLTIFNKRLYGIWVIGAQYQRESNYYGAYPRTVKERILSLFPDRHGKILHLFSGRINDLNSITYDIKPENNPTILDDVRNIGKHKQELQDVELVIADPPYQKPDFEKYGVKPFTKSAVLRDLGAITQKGCCLAWLDLYAPMYRKDTWNLLGYIGIVITTNAKIRCLSLFEHV